MKKLQDELSMLLLLSKKKHFEIGKKISIKFMRGLHFFAGLVTPCVGEQLWGSGLEEFEEQNKRRIDELNVFGMYRHVTECTTIQLRV